MTLEVQLRHQLGSFHLDVAFAAGEARVTALFGPSGAGKTTIVNAIAGLLRPADGRIVIGDRVLLDTKAGVFVPPRLRRVGYVFQDARLFPHMTVEDNLLFGWKRSGRRADAKAIAQVRAMLGLDRLRGRYPVALSGGEKSRVALGRVLLASPDILLLDEPLAALDAARRGEILPYLEALRDQAGLPMIYISHAFDEVARLAHAIVVLRNGRVLRQDSVFALATLQDVRDLAGAVPLGALLDAVVETPRDGEGLTVLAFDGGKLRIAALARGAGTKLRIRLRAEDIMIAAEEPRAISANNVLPAAIEAIHHTDDTHCDIQLRLGPSRLVARITAASASRLALQENQTVYAIIKAVTVDL